jgi:arabinose-5-phosphate isomerase
MKIKEIIEQVLLDEKNGIAKCISSVDDNCIKCVETISSLNGKLIISGIGKSGLIAQKLAATFSSTGTPSMFLHPTEAGHGDLGIVQSTDALLLISFNGEQREFNYFFSFCNRNNIPIIGLTGNKSSSLYKKADIPIHIPIKNESKIMPYVPSVSSTATLAIGDSIALAVAKIKNFAPEDFAKLHPGGSLGVLLNRQVFELMHSGDSIPFLSLDTTITDILYIISSFRLGIGIVVNENKKMLGLITDGDIRRTFEKYGKTGFDLLARNIMTKDPCSIVKNKLAKDAMKIMEKNKITVLPVLDDNKVIGVIHLHDILGGRNNS